MAAPLLVMMSFIIYFVYKRISLESQLVDYWWRINYKDIEIILSRRKNAGDGSTSGAANGSLVSSSRGPSDKAFQTEINSHRGGQHSSGVVTNSVTKETETSTAFANSAADVCYGNIILGNYKLAKVALKPISKLHQTRKLMIDLRTVNVI